MFEVCQIQGCNGLMRFVVTRGNQTLTVCRKCAEEMTAIHGWEFEKLIELEEEVRR